MQPPIKYTTFVFETEPSKMQKISSSSRFFLWAQLKAPARSGANFGQLLSSRGF